MFKIKTINAISPLGLEMLPADRFTVSADEENPQGILVRSASLHDMEFGDQLLAIGRAGAGVNNIPVDRCTQLGIPVFNAPGGNANGVKELVLGAMLLTSRDIVGGIEWADTQKGETDVANKVEKEKSRFGGTEIYGKKLGVIGLGAIGALVANSATDLGMEVSGLDEYISVESAWTLRPSVKRVTAFSQLGDCDFITVHVPLTKDTKGMINEDFLSKVKDGVVILNFARGELVDNEAIIKGLSSGKVAQYVTDFPQDETVGVKGIVNIPHLGASTEESEENCAKMAARELKHYLQYGNILNSVNFPDTILPYTGKTRLAVVHKNVPKALSRLLSGISDEGLNIDNMINRSQGDIAYTLIDLDDAPKNGVASGIGQLEEVISIRVI